MQTGAITDQIDVAQLALVAFVLFFFGLVLYLRREDRREGYPLVGDRNDRDRAPGLATLARPKRWLMNDGQTQVAPRIEPKETIATARALEGFPGAPMVPIGDPMLAAVGPGAYAFRANDIDHTFDDNLPNIVPLRVASRFFLATEDPDPRGMAVLGHDKAAAGTVVDVWIDRAEVVLRYLEVELTPALGGRRVLLPSNFADRIDDRRREVRVNAITAAQFANVPALSAPETITLAEEDKITAYYAGGTLFSTPRRSEPLL